VFKQFLEEHLLFFIKLFFNPMPFFAPMEKLPIEEKFT